MNKNELLLRTRQFAVHVFRFCEKLPRSDSSKIVVNQLLRSASPVAANYRAVNRAKSRVDFVNKLKVVLEEADESNFWLSFVTDIGLAKPGDNEVEFLLKESDEFVVIFTASIKTINRGQ